MTFSFSGMQESFWHIASFNTTEQDEFTKSMSFEDELGRAVTQFPDGLDKRYFYKHSDTQSVFYIPPELIGGRFTKIKIHLIIRWTTEISNSTITVYSK